MLYQISVDGERKQVEVKLNENSLSADNDARKAIIDHFINEEGAENVVIESAGTGRLER